MADTRRNTTTRSGAAKGRPARNADGNGGGDPNEGWAGEDGPPRNSTYIPIPADAEAAVVAAVLTSPDTYFEVSERLSPDDFGVPALREIYRAIVACDTAGRPFDQVTVADELTRAKTLAEVGGREALARLVGLAVEVDNVIAHVEIVAEKALLRRVVTAGRTMSAAAMQPDADGPSVVAMAETAVFELGRPKGESSLVEMPQAVAEMLKDLAKGRSNALVGHSFGFPELDRLTGGAQGGQLIIVAARPGAGKTTFALQLARHIAESTGLVVPFLSYEMSCNELTLKLLANALEYDQLRLRTGDLPPGMDRDLADHAQRLAQLPMMLDDNPPETIGGLRSAMRRLARRCQLGAIVVDYLQLMSAEGRFRDSNRTQEVSEISRGLKRLGQEIDVPVIALSQLNRALENRPNKRPVLSDMRESGCMTEDTTLLRADTGAPVTFGELLRNGHQGVLVWSLDAQRRMVPAPVTAVFPSGVKTVYRLRLASGREVKASGNHPFLTFTGWRRLDELTSGNRIAVPRIVPGPPGAGLGWSETRIGLLAHLIGAGHVLRKQPVHYTSMDEENLSFVEESAAEFGISARRVAHGKCQRVYLPTPAAQTNRGGNPLHSWFRELGIYNLRSSEKRLPDVLYRASEAELRVFLRHLWSTDGRAVDQSSARSRAAGVSYQSPSRALVDGVAVLLQRFGVVARISSVRKENYRVDWRLRIEDGPSLRTFYAEIGVHGTRAAQVTDPAQEGAGDRANTNGDELPRAVWPVIEQEQVRAGVTERQFQAAVAANCCGSTLAETRSSRQRLLCCAEEFNSDVLRDAMTDDVFWDQVAEITPLGEFPVFDATVDGTHNFVADGIIAHNSLEQDANLVLALYRDSLYNPGADPTLAEALILKQRNGPVGDTVYLEFLGPAGGKFKPTNRKPAGTPAGVGAAGAGSNGGFGGTGGFGGNPF